MSVSDSNLKDDDTFSLTFPPLPPSAPTTAPAGARVRQLPAAPSCWLAGRMLIVTTTHD